MTDTFFYNTKKKESETLQNSNLQLDNSMSAISPEVFWISY